MSPRHLRIYVATVLPCALALACIALSGCGGSPVGPPETPPQVPTIVAAVSYYDSSSAGIAAPTSPPNAFVDLKIGSPIAALIIVSLASPNAANPLRIVESDDCTAILRPYVVIGGSEPPGTPTISQISASYLPRAVGTCTLRYAGAGVATSVPVTVTP